MTDDEQPMPRARFDGYHYLVIENKGTSVTAEQFRFAVDTKLLEGLFYNAEPFDLMHPE